MQTKASILTIGDEILIGQIVNTNAAFIARQLNLFGAEVVKTLTVGDKKQEILNALENCGKEADIVLITGGLGPTSDDITKPALCEYFNTHLRFDEQVYQMVEAFVKKRNGVMNPLNKAQANVPINAKVLLNYTGTAPGLWLEKDNVVYISMPGVPFEMEKMLVEHVLPELKKHFNLGNIYHKTVLTTGIAESLLAIKLENWEKQLPAPVKLAYLPSPGMVKLRLSVYEHVDAENLVAHEIEKLNAVLGESIWGFDIDTMETVVGTLLKNKGKTLATAESCTGGNIARLITSVPGSSQYFKGAIVAYSNEVKIEQLGVPVELIEKHGAVSREVVESMALGALKVLKSNCSISVSGIAGPDGGTSEKPVGTVWIAVAVGEKLVSKKFLVGDHRERNIAISSSLALDMLRKLLLQM